MVKNITVNRFEFELELELKPNQPPSRKKGWSLDSVNIKANDYDLDNNIDVLGDSKISHRRE
jgi:hypothetical protein